jgi:imidazolonepropionase-like amidohydrolase
MKSLFIRARMIEDDERDLVIVDGVIADARPMPGTEPAASGWVLPGLADVHNHLSLASPAGGPRGRRRPGPGECLGRTRARGTGYPRSRLAGRCVHAAGE